MFDFYEILDRAPPKLTVVDVGAAAMQTETDPYHVLSALPNVEVIGFEPNRDACTRRNAEARPNHRYYPYFIAGRGRRDFHVCRNPLTSSLYAPNEPVLDKLQMLNRQLLAETVLQVETVRLDDIEDLVDCDYLKLDVQGAELDVLEGAPALLGTVSVIHTEAEFVPLYKSQPLFGDIDRKLRDSGFQLHKLVGLRYRAPILRQTPAGQILYVEGAVYVRDFMRFDEMSVTKLINLACILHTVYGSFDHCALALASVDRQAGTDLRDRYVRRMNQSGLVT